MSPQAKKAVEALDKVEWPEHMPGPTYCVVKTPEGEFPTAHMFSSPENLATFIHDLDGQDVCVWAFYGLPVAMTKGPRRALILPDDTYLPVDASLRKLDVDPETIEIQEDGFLGPPALSISTSRIDEDKASSDAARAKAANKKASEADPESSK